MLIAFYNKRNYSVLSAALPSPEPSHKRTNSTSAVILEDPALAKVHHPRTASHGEQDVFPPRRSASSDASMPYNPDDMMEFFLHEYEAVVNELFGEADTDDDDWDDLDLVVARGGPGPVEKDGPAWNRLGEIMRAKGVPEDDAISDSESIISVGELGEDARLPGAGIPSGEEDPNLARLQRRTSGNENTWEHMSPILSLLPRSPAERRASERRASAGGSPLRPVRRPTLGGDVFNEDDDGDEEDDERGPMPIEKGTEDERAREHGAVDEVEYLWGR